MSFELSGKLIEKMDEVQVSDKFKKREFVLETSEENNGRVFTETIKFQTIQDRTSLVNDFNVGDEVKVSFNIKGNKWERDGKVNYFTNLDAWRIEAAGGSSQTPSPSPQQENAPSSPPPMPPMEDEGDHDLPF